jgi:hypothetical protein
VVSHPCIAAKGKPPSRGGARGDEGSFAFVTQTAGLFYVEAREGKGGPTRTLPADTHLLADWGLRLPEQCGGGASPWRQEGPGVSTEADE